MKILTTNSLGKSVSIVCNQITMVEEQTDKNSSYIYTVDGKTIPVDMHYLEVVGFLKSFD
jgi:hypothetical protein